MYVRLTGLVPGVRVSDWSGSGPAGDCPADCRPSAHRIVGTETHCGTVPSVFISLQPLAALAGPCRGQSHRGCCGGGGGGGEGWHRDTTPPLKCIPSCSLNIHSRSHPLTLSAGKDRRQEAILLPCPTERTGDEKPSSVLIRRKGQVTRSLPLTSSAGKGQVTRSLPLSSSAGKDR